MSEATEVEVTVNAREDCKVNAVERDEKKWGESADIFEYGSAANPDMRPIQCWCTRRIYTKAARRASYRSI